MVWVEWVVRIYIDGRVMHDSEVIHVRRLGFDLNPTAAWRNPSFATTGPW